MTIIKTMMLFISVCFGLFISILYGPIVQLGTVYVVDEQYTGILYRQYYFSGFVASLVGCVLGYFLRSSFPTIILSIIVTGLIFTSYSQLGDPESIEYLESAIVEFMIPYLSVGTVIIFILYVVNKRWPRIGNNNAGA